MKKRITSDVSRDGTGGAVRWEGLSGFPADGRILTDAHGPALHRADRDALCVGGQERRRFVEAQEEAEEAHCFERKSEEGSIILSHDRPIKSAARRLTYNWVVSKLEASTASLLLSLVTSKSRPHQ